MYDLHCSPDGKLLVYLWAERWLWNTDRYGARPGQREKKKIEQGHSNRAGDLAGSTAAWTEDYPEPSDEFLERSR